MPEAGLDFHIRWLKLIHRDLATQHMGKSLNNLKMIKQTIQINPKTRSQINTRTFKRHLTGHWCIKNCLAQSPFYIMSSLDRNFLNIKKKNNVGKKLTSFRVLKSKWSLQVLNEQRGFPMTNIHHLHSPRTLCSSISHLIVWWYEVIST